MQIGIKNNKLNFASGAFSSSMSAAALEFIVNIIDYNLPVSEVVSLPRFGDQAWDINTLKMADGWWLDPRVDENIVNELALCGLKFINKGYVDTGLGAIVKVQDNGTVDGAFAPLSAVGLTKERE